MNHEFWYLSRAAGFTAYLLLFVSVALGIGIGTRLGDRIMRRNVAFDLHRFTTILALVFTLFHVYILLGDSYFHLNVWQLSLPFLSPYRGWQTAVGVASLYLMIVIITTFYVRRFIGYRAWRAVHFATFALYAGATLHSITAGTDTSQAWAKLLYLSTGLATLTLVLYRVQNRVPDEAGQRTLRLAAAVGAVVVAVLLLTATGLVDATRTAPSSLVQSEPQPPTSAPTQATPDAHPFLASFQTTVRGTYTQSEDASNSRLALDATASGDMALRLHVELTQTRVSPSPDDETSEYDPNDNEQQELRPQMSVTLNKAQILDASSGDMLCDGQLTSLNGSQLQFGCDGAGPYNGVHITMSGRVNSTRNGSFTGVMSGNMRRLT